MIIDVVGIVIGFAMIAIVFYPLAIYTIYGWARKKNDIISSVSPLTARIYLKRFQGLNVPEINSIVEFSKFYNRWYGRQQLIFPMIILLVIVSCISFVFVETGIYRLKLYNNLPTGGYINLPLIATAAVAGAYVFVAWDLIWRTARRDVSGTAILGSAVRLVVSVPLGYSMAALLAEGLGPFIAFALGAFPLETVQNLLQRAARSQLKIDADEVTSKDQVTELSCVDRNVAERLRECDIITVSQLAYCDPIQTCMRTNFDFAFVADIVAQALAWMYLGNKLGDLSLFGLRGAVEIRMLYNGCQNENEDERQRCQKLLSDVASHLGISEGEFGNVVEQIGDDPYTVFLEQSWMSSEVSESSSPSLE